MAYGRSWPPAAGLARTTAPDPEQPDTDGSFRVRGSAVSTSAFGSEKFSYDAPLYRGLSSMVTPNCAACLRRPSNTASCFSMLTGDPICSAV
jgi:hypothetical protein